MKKVIFSITAALLVGGLLFGAGQWGFSQSGAIRLEQVAGLIARLNLKANTTDSRFPTTNEKAALAGQSPSGANLFITQSALTTQINSGLSTRAPLVHNHNIADIQDRGSVGASVLAANTTSAAATALGIGTAANLNAKADIADRYITQDYALNRPSIVTIISGQADEPTPICSSCTATLDTNPTSTRIANRGWKITTSGAVTAQFIQTYTPSMFFGQAAAIGSWVYLDPADVGKLTQLVFEIYLDSGLTITWTRSRQNATEPFVAGWNHMRWVASAGTTLANLRNRWGTVFRVRVLAVTNAALTGGLTLGQMWAEVWPKAQIMFIGDRGYKTFLTSFYPQLRARGIPVEWSLDPALLGTSSADAEVITENDVRLVAQENRNRIGYHGWDGSVTSSMTAAQLQTDSIRAIRWLTARGYGPVLWRSAFVQNSAPNASAVQPYHVALATSTSGAQAVSAWPHPSPFNIDRTALHSLTPAQMDDTFELLNITRGLFVVYTHAVQTSGTNPNDITPANRDYFLSKLDVALTGGWIEGVTFNELFLRDGGAIQRGAAGEDFVLWRGVDGVQQQLRLP
jgi:hypothetical protein